MSTNRAVLRLLRIVGHQDWIRMGIRTRILRHWCDPATVGHHEFEVDFFGHRYRGDLQSYIDWMVFFFGAYEKQELFLLRDAAQRREGAVFLDIGANVGQHSLFMSRHCRQVHAFEPFAPVRASLKQKVALNAIENIVVHEVAIGDRDEMLEFFAPRGSNAATGSFLPEHETDNNGPIGKLKVVSGDSYIEQLCLERVDVVKIDVEGFERNVLKGLSQTLRKHRPTILMEFSEDTRNSFAGGAEELRTLLPDGYSIRLVVPERKRWVFFNRPRYSLEDFRFHDMTGNLLLAPQETP